MFDVDPQELHAAVVLYDIRDVELSGEGSAIKKKGAAIEHRSAR